MSLLDGAKGQTAVAIKVFADELDAGGREDRAVLLNLKEEDRLPRVRRTEFQKALETSSGTARERLRMACQAGGQALPVPTKKRHKVKSEWRTYTTLDKLQRYGFASGAAVAPTEAPPRLPLARRYGTGSKGESYPFWITNMSDGGNADEVRDRLGLAHVPAGEVLYRVGIRVDRQRSLHIPSAVDAGFSPPWRRPPNTHTEPWGLTRDLRNDFPAEAELLATPSDDDHKYAERIGLLHQSPPTDYLIRRIP